MPINVTQSLFKIYSSGLTYFSCFKIKCFKFHGLLRGYLGVGQPRIKIWVTVLAPLQAVLLLFFFKKIYLKLRPLLGSGLYVPYKMVKSTRYLRLLLESGLYSRAASNGAITVLQKYV